MTVVAAFRRGDTVWMGADRMSTDTDSVGMTGNALVNSKIIPVGDALVGLAGEHIIHTLVRYHKPPAPKAGDETVLWIQNKLLPWLEKTIDKLDPKKSRFSMIVARGSELFSVDRNNKDAVPVEVYAIGTGEPYALGALHAQLQFWQGADASLMRSAIEAACHHDPYCGGGIDVAHTGPEHEEVEKAVIR